MKTIIRAVPLRLVVGRLIRASAERRRPINYKMFLSTFALIAVGIFLIGCGNTITLQPTATRAPSASPVSPSATLVSSVAPSFSPSVIPTAYSSAHAHSGANAHGSPTHANSFSNRHPY